MTYITCQDLCIDPLKTLLCNSMGLRKPRRDFRLRTSDFRLQTWRVECRKQRRLRRSRYGTPGPNFLWHIDGWDKLAPFGTFIHEAVDGFSRRILWLAVNSTNKNPSIISFSRLCITQISLSKIFSQFPRETIFNSAYSLHPHRFLWSLLSKWLMPEIQRPNQTRSTKVASLESEVWNLNSEFSLHLPPKFPVCKK